MDKTTFIIWKEVEDCNINGVRDAVGIFQGTWDEADTIVEDMNQRDASVKRSIFGRWSYGYFKTEPQTISVRNFKEFIEQ